MSLDIYIYKCTKEDYQLRKDNPDVLSWMCLDALYASENIPTPTSLMPDMTAEQRALHSCEFISGLNGSHLYNWLILNTELSLESPERVVFKETEIVALRDVCEKLMQEGVAVDGSINRELFQKQLPLLEGYYFSEGCDYDESYLADIEYAQEMLEYLIEETDFENEVVLIKADW